MGSTGQRGSRVRGRLPLAPWLGGYVGLTELQPTPGDGDIEPAGPGTSAVPGLLLVRLDGPLYTANVRSVNRKIVAAVEGHPGTEVVVLDATSVARLTLTVTQEFSELDCELHDLGVVAWVAGLAPPARSMLERLPLFAELERDGRVHPTTLAALNAFRARALRTHAATSL
jgi:SulP family sulfate permease